MKFNIFYHNDEECNCGHDHDCDCGCEDTQTMILTLDDDSELKCSVLDIFTVDEKDYIALLPQGEDEVIIYSYNEDEDGQGVQLGLIESDEEFEKVEDAFFAGFDDDLFDDDFDDDDLEEEE